MNEPFHSSNSVAGVEGGAGWRPQGSSDLILAIFSDTLSVTSGLSLREVPAGRREDGVGPEDSWFPGEEACGQVSSARRFDRGVLMSDQGRTGTVPALFTCILGPITVPDRKSTRLNSSH